MEKKEETKQRLSRENLREALKIFEFVRPYRRQFVFGLVLLFFCQQHIYGISDRSSDKCSMWPRAWSGQF
ncbi:MAG: hypothetical protein V9G23_18515 [Giesbergeria sp.]